MGLESLLGSYSSLKILILAVLILKIVIYRLLNMKLDILLSILGMPSATYRDTGSVTESPSSVITGFIFHKVALSEHSLRGWLVCRDGLETQVFHIICVQAY